MDTDHIYHLEDAFRDDELSILYLNGYQWSNFSLQVLWEEQIIDKSMQLAWIFGYFDGCAHLNKEPQQDILDRYNFLKGVT